MSEAPRLSRSGRPVVTLEEYRRRIGAPPSTSGWLTVDQEMIDRFAEVTGDDAIDHVDPERAARMRFGGAVAHGTFVLSLVPLLMRGATPLIRGTRLGANYGYDKVRFPAPLRVGGRVRAWFTLCGIDDRGPGFHVLSYDISVEAEGQEKPVLAARWLIARWVEAD